MSYERPRQRPCPVCQAPAIEHRSDEAWGRTIECRNACGTYTIATGFYAHLRAAASGSGRLAGELATLSRALRTQAIVELLDATQVLAELQDFIAFEQQDVTEEAGSVPLDNDGSPAA